MSDLLNKLKENVDKATKNQRETDFAAAEFGDLLRKLGVPENFTMPLLVQKIYEKGFEDGMKEKDANILSKTFE